MLEKFFEDDMDLDHTIFPSYNVEYMNDDDQDEGYIIKIAIPGADKQGLSAEWISGHLYVSNVIKETTKEPKYLIHHFKEATNFELNIALPKIIGDPKIKAQYTNGILYIYIKNDRAKTKKLNIE